MSWFKKKNSSDLNEEFSEVTETASGLLPLSNEKIKEIVRTYYEKVESGFWGEIKEHIALTAKTAELTEEQMILNILSTSPFYKSVVVLDSIVVGFMGSNEYYAEAEGRRISGDHLGKATGVGHPTYIEYPETMAIMKALKRQFSAYKNMPNRERDKMIQTIAIQTLELHHNSNEKGDSGELTSAIWQAFSRVAMVNVMAYEIKNGLDKSPLVFSDYLKNLWHFAEIFSLLYYEVGRDKDPKVKEFLGIGSEKQE